jgi:hypothetical protein
VHFYHFFNTWYHRMHFYWFFQNIQLKTYTFTKFIFKIFDTWFAFLSVIITK